MSDAQLRDHGRQVARFVLLGGLALIVVAVGALTFTFKERPGRPGVAPGRATSHAVVPGDPPASVPAAPASRPAESVELAPTCDGAPCQPVPRGLKKWQFGMTIAEVKALPEKATDLAPAVLGAKPAAGDLAPAAKGARPAAGDLAPAAKGAKAAARVTAKRLQVRTTLAGQAATCVLLFAVDERLSQVSCGLGAPKSADDHRGLEQTVLKALRGRYGPERRAVPHRGLSAERARAHRSQVGTFAGPHQRVNIYKMRSVLAHTARWAWWDDAARLELLSEFERVGRRRATSVVEVRNTSAAHEALVSKLEAEAPETSDL
jgi:hypothetical protein